MSSPREVTGIVVGRFDYGEADRIVRLLTAEEGRVGVLVRGARRAGARSAGLDLAAGVRVQLRAGRGELAAFAGVEVLAARARLREDLTALATAIYACDLCGALAREGQPEPRLYGLLETALLLLDATAAPPGAAFLAGVEAKALTFAGVAPVLDRCAVCAGAPEPAMVFAIDAGGLCHPRCAEGEPVTPEHAAALEAARRAPLRALLDRPLPPGPPRLLYAAARAHLGRELPSRRVLDALH